ncbi:MAG: tetratricopeptide repeat protein [Acidobacteriota bacterium]|nr:tetratricopeptide repeat protein [Acidobacteriota bacterium]
MGEDAKHLDSTRCDALLRGDLSPRAAARSLFRHLLELCPECRAGWQGYWRAAAEGRDAEAIPERAETQEELEAAVERVIGRVESLRQRVQQERDQAEKLFQELQRLPDLPARVQRVRRSKRFRSWALCERLLGESLGLSFERPEEASALAELAVETAWALDDGHLGRELISDLMARGWAALAHARRLGGRPQLAEEAFAMARYFLEQGSGDPLGVAEVAGLDALVHRDRGQLAEALQLHHRCVAIYEGLGSAPQLATALLQRATTHATAANFEAAAEDLRRCLEILNPEKLGPAFDPRLRLCAEHSLIWTLHRLGEHEEARERLANLVAEPTQPANPWARWSRAWLQAELARGADAGESPQRYLAKAQQSLVDGGVFHPTALPPRSLLAVLLESTQAAGTVGTTTGGQREDNDSKS